MTMRYRKFGYRYTLSVSVNETRPEWRSAQLNVIAKPCWQPFADIYETHDTVYITVELSGVNTEDIEISLYENALIISGIRRINTEVAECVFHAAEIKQGPFRLELSLPASINPDKVEARYDLGLARIVLPKK
jgi:HSP20 family protein